jgi:hypothetical protein
VIRRGCWARFELTAAVKCSGDSVLIGSALGRLSDQLIEQFGEGMSRTDTPMAGGIAATVPDTPEARGNTQIRRPDIHL